MIAFSNSKDIYGEKESSIVVTISFCALDIVCVKRIVFSFIF